VRRLVVVAFLSGHRLLELPESRAELLAETRQPLGPEDDEHDHEDQDYFERADLREHGLQASKWMHLG